MKTLIFAVLFVLLLIIFPCSNLSLYAQPVMETGGQKMPDEWIDKSTGHRVIKLTRKEGSNLWFIRFGI